MPRKDHLSMPIADAWAVFRLHCKAQRYRPKTIAFYDEKLPPFFRWLSAQQVAALEAITTHHIRSYLVERQTIFRDTPQEREASGHTMHGIARAIRAYLNFCVLEQWLEVSPMQNVKMPRRPKRILEAYTVQEIKLLMKAADDDRERALISVLLDTGVRASECTNIQVADISLENNSIFVRAGKGEKDRTVYFGAKTAGLLIRHIRGMRASDYVWANSHNRKRLLYRGFAKLLRVLGERVGVDCTAHKFRRTFAINSLRNGMNVYLLAKLMGHEDISILKPYLDLLEADLQHGQMIYGVVDNL